MHFQRHEVVAEHQLCRDAANELRIDPLLAEVDERAVIMLGELLGPLAFNSAVASFCD